MKTERAANAIKQQPTNHIEIIKPRSYVSCLRAGLSFPLLHFGEIARFLLPIALVVALVTPLLWRPLYSMLRTAPTYIEWCLILFLVFLLVALFKVLLLHILYQQRRLVALGYIPKTNSWQVWRDIFHLPRRAFSAFKMRYMGHTLMVLLLSALVAALVAFAGSLPQIVFSHINSEVALARAMEDSVTLPSYYSFLNYIVSVVALLVGQFALLLILYSLLFHWGSITAIERERQAYLAESNTTE